MLLGAALKAESNVPSAFKRATKLRVVPLTVVNGPPISTLPSDCTAIWFTEEFGPEPELKLVSKLPSAFSRPIKLRDTPFSVVKNPPTRTFASVCTPTAFTQSLAPVLESNPVSTLPSVFNRAM